MKVVLHILFALGLLISPQVHAGSSGNPCADEGEVYCGDYKGKAVRECLARKRNKISESCREHVVGYYEENPNEKLPEAEEEIQFGEKKEGRQNQPAGLGYGVPSWNYYPSPGFEPKPTAPSAPVAPSAPPQDCVSGWYTSGCGFKWE